MTVITSVPQKLEPVIGQEMAAESFKFDGAQYNLNIDPASNVVATQSATGTLLTAPVAAASVVTKFVFDAIGKKITVAVDGTADAVIDIAALDDEGTKLVINGQNLELQNAAGVVLSSTPIGQLDAQQLTGAAAAAGYKITLSNGGDVTITPADLAVMYPTAAPTATKEVMTKDGTSLKIRQAVSSGGTLLNYWVLVA